MNRRSRLLAVSKLWGWPARLRSGRYTAYDPAALATELQRAGFLPDEQIFYGHFLAGGRLVLSRPEMEHAAPPGSRDPWARQFLLVARRAPSG